MAAMFLQPWRFLLRSTFVLFFCISLLPSPSFSQSDSPQNIETFFPNDALVPAPPPLSNLPPSPSPPQKSSSNGSEIRRAVLITAASTVVVAAAFFFFLQKCVIARRRRDRVAVESALRPDPLPPETVLAREGFTRFGGNVKGLIVDENGLDVLYWRKLQRDKSESFRKEVVNREAEDGGDGDGDGDGGGEEKKVIYYKKKEKSEPVSEIPLLRGKSSTSHSVIHHEIHENYKHATSPPPIKIKSFSFKTVETSETESSPPPPTTTMQNQGTSAPPPPPPPPPIPSKKASPSPSPVPPPLPISLKKGSSPPPPPAMALTPTSSKPPPAPKGGSAKEHSSNGQVKLKPLHWDKVNPDSDHSMVWDKIDRGSFSFDGDLMEALFGYVAKKSPEQNSTSPSQIFILDPRKSQNTAIVIKSLGITHEELIDAFINGHDFTSDILDRLSRIAPTKDEQLAILDFDGDPRKLADAESFLFHLLKAVPSAFTRLNALLFKANYNPEITHHKQCLQILDSACKELRAHGLFIKLLEAILKAGNRMNAGTARGNAQAFNLTALLKLSDVKSVDQKTTLLHFVVEEVVRSEGKRCVMNRNLSRSNSNRSNSNSDSSQTMSKEEQEKEYLKHGLPIIGGLSAQFINVKKAAGLDHDALTATCTALMTRAKDTRQVLAQIEGNQKGDRFEKKMIAFLDSVVEETKLAREEETKVMEFVKRTTDYYQAGALKGKNPFQLFVIISDFLDMVDKVCLDITKNLQKRTTGGSSSGSRPMRNAVKFPVLPPNFMSDKYRSDSGGFHSDQ